MSPFCSAFAIATEWAERTFAAIAALIGAATFALISDIAARSGSSSPASAFSSSRLSCLYSCGWSPMLTSFRELGRLIDRGVLLRFGERCRVVREDVRSERDVDRDRE